MNRIIGGNLLRTVFLLCVGTIVLTGCGSPGASSETVTFDSNGGSAVSSQSVESGKTATKPPDPTKDGFVFIDWYTDAELTTAYDFSTAVNADITLYAKWNREVYTVTFESNGGSAVDSQEVKYESTATKPTNPTRNGFTFTNWYADSNLTLLYDFHTSVTANITLYARWVDDTVTIHTVTFDSNGGSAVASQNVEDGATATRQSDPTRNGFNFEGWYSDANLTTAYNFSTAVTANITLYAKWNREVYTVTFDSNGGSAVSSQFIKYESTATKPTDPTRNGFNFEGWYSDANLTTAYNFSTAVTANITLYAKWGEYTLKAIIDSGTIPQDLTPYSDLVHSVLKPYTSGNTINAFYVKENVAGLGDGSSWDNAKGADDLKTTIDGAGGTNVSLVLVASGTYTPSATLSMKNNVAIVGGWDATSSDSNWQRSGTTTLDGGNARKVFDNTGEFNNPLNRTALLYGVTVSNGNSSTGGGGMHNSYSSPTITNVVFSKNSTNTEGGGMYNGASSSPILTNVVFSDNSAGTDGGGMCNIESSLILINVVFSRNSAANGGGGGMANVDSSPILTNVNFSQNSAGYFGGGISNASSSTITNSSLTITNAVFSQNSTIGTIPGASRGGGIYNKGSSLTITNVVFSKNSVTNSGGGMANDSASPILTNVVFYKNSATNGGGGLLHDGAEEVASIINTIFWGNHITGDETNTISAQIYMNNNNASGETINIYNSIVQHGLAYDGTGGVGRESSDTTTNPITFNSANILETNPVLSDLADNGGEIQTMAIGSGSPAIDAGLYVQKDGTTLYYSEDNTAWFTDPEDTTNTAILPTNAEIVNSADARDYDYKGRPDIGAYEYGY